MNLFIRSPWNPNRAAFEFQVKEMLGLGARQKLPKEGMPERVIDGITVWVAPYVERWGTHRWTGKAVLLKSSKHRVMGRCPQCGKEMGVGRLAQHAKVHS